MFFCIIGVSFTLGKASWGTGMPRNWKFKKCDISDLDLDQILSCTTDYDISDLELQHLTLKCITLQRGSQPCLTCHTRSLSAGTSLITWCLSIQWRSWIGFVLGKSKTISIPLPEHSLERKRSMNHLGLPSLKEADGFLLTIFDSSKHAAGKGGTQRCWSITNCLRSGNPSKILKKGVIVSSHWAV